MTRAQKRGHRSAASISTVASARGLGLPFLHGHLGKAERRAGEGGHLAGHAHHRQRIGPVRGDLDLEDRVVEAEIGREIGAERRVRRELEDAVVSGPRPSSFSEQSMPSESDAPDRRGLDLAAAGQGRARRRERRAQPRRRRSARRRSPRAGGPAARRGRGGSDGPGATRPAPPRWPRSRRPRRRRAPRRPARSTRPRRPH